MAFFIRLGGGGGGGGGGSGGIIGYEKISMKQVTKNILYDKVGGI